MSELAVTGSLALDQLRRHGDDPSAVLGLDDDTEHFRSPGLDGFIAYRRYGRWLLQIGGPYAPESDRRPLLRAFTAHAEQSGSGLLAVQLQARDAADAWRLGFTLNQLGASYALRIADVSLRGRHFMQLRNKISRARRAGVVVEQTRYADLADPDRIRLAELDAEWLRAKHAKPLRFLVGRLGGRAEPLRRLVLGRVDGRIVGYLSLSQVFGTRPGWLHDLSRRADDAPPGVMELLVAESLDVLGRDGAEWWHFGFTPFTGLDPTHELPGASATVGRLVRLLAERGQRIYPSAGQVDYKRKWGEPQLLPDYLAFASRPRLGGIAALVRAANLL